MPFVIAAHPSVPANIDQRADRARQGEAGHDQVFDARERVDAITSRARCSKRWRGSSSCTCLTKAPDLPRPLRSPAKCSSSSPASARVRPQWKAGKLKVLAFGAEKRHPNWPDIPSTGEAGLKGYEAGTWFGVVTRAGTPRADRRQAQHRDRRRARGAGIEGALHRDRLRRLHGYARRVRALHQNGHGARCESDQGGRDQTDGLTATVRAEPTRARLRGCPGASIESWQAVPTPSLFSASR